VRAVPNVCINFHECCRGVSDPVDTDNDQSGSSEVHTKRQGTWADSETEKTIRSLTNFAKSYRSKNFHLHILAIDASILLSVIDYRIFASIF